MKLFSAAVIAALLAASAAYAAPANGGFEDNSLSGWYPLGQVDVVTSAQDISQVVTVDPAEGRYFAELVAGEDVELYTSLTRLLTVDPGAILSFSTGFFSWDEYNPDENLHNDEGFVRILGPGMDEIVFSADVAGTTPYGFSGWQSFSRTLTLGGTYTFIAAVRNGDDDGSDFEGPADTAYSSRLLLDNLQITTAAVPEPATWAMMIGGFGIMGGVLRRRRALALV